MSGLLGTDFGVHTNVHKSNTTQNIALRTAFEVDILHLMCFNHVYNILKSCKMVQSTGMHRTVEKK